MPNWVATVVEFAGAEQDIQVGIITDTNVMSRVQNIKDVWGDECDVWYEYRR